MKIKEGLQFKGKAKTSLKRKDSQIILLKMKICLRLKKKVLEKYLKRKKRIEKVIIFQ
jgi:hypothetical protein